jgi:dipeptidase E
MSTNLLLLSNSRSADGSYLAHATEAIAEIAGARTRAVFIPYAGVTVGWDDYAQTVRDVFAPLGIAVDSVHTAADPRALVAAAEIIVVGGGNTFNLLKCCRDAGLLPVIAEAVRGGAAYIGWSAGANLAGPTIRTTNDMPIVDPGGFDALGLVPFQLNPHYTNALPAGHQGETREQRLQEFLCRQPAGAWWACPKATGCVCAARRCGCTGLWPAKLFAAGRPVRSLDAPAQLVF